MKELYLKIRKNISGLISFVRVLNLRIKAVKIGHHCIIEGGVLFDKLYPELISIGDNVLIARGVKIFSHDHCKRVSNELPMSARVTIGNNTFIAADTIILPGVKLGNNTIVGAGSVVTKSFPPNCVLAGNPAKIIRRDVSIGNMGILKDFKVE